MRSIATSIYTFSKLRENDCLYVDKTSYIHRLLQDKGGQFFCARPRRFGKSLAVSTIEAIFRGRRELFLKDCTLQGRTMTGRCIRSSISTSGGMTTAPWSCWRAACREHFGIRPGNMGYRQRVDRRRICLTISSASCIRNMTVAWCF